MNAVSSKLLNVWKVLHARIACHEIVVSNADFGIAADVVYESKIKRIVGANRVCVNINAGELEPLGAFIGDWKLSVRTGGDIHNSLYIGS